MNKWWLALVIASLPIAQVYSYGGFGICNYGKENVSSIICYGPAVLKDTTITGDIKVAGSLTAEGITAESMTIAGAVNLQSSIIKGTVQTTGSFEANGVEFVKDLIVTSTSVKLVHSKIDGSIRINSQQDKPTIIVQCGTNVTGTITFNGKPGVVQITGDSNLQAKIINGTQEFIKVNCS